MTKLKILNFPLHTTFPTSGLWDCLCHFFSFLFVFFIFQIYLYICIYIICVLYISICYIHKWQKKRKKRQIDKYFSPAWWTPSFISCANDNIFIFKIFSHKKPHQLFSYNDIGDRKYYPMKFRHSDLNKNLWITIFMEQLWKIYWELEYRKKNKTEIQREQNISPCNMTSCSDLNRINILCCLSVATMLHGCAHRTTSLSDFVILFFIYSLSY